VPIWVYCSFARLLLIRQPGNTHGIYRSGQVTPTDPFVHSPLPICPTP
jgi:hypothetical protein